jgi:ABC-2 type transport system permease protein
MQKIITSAGKELLLLMRDRAGLLVLFIMPAILVVVITLVQENVLELTGQRDTEIVFVDEDGGALGLAIRSYLKTEHVKIVEWCTARQSTSDIHQAINDGQYQAAIVIAARASDRLQRELEILFGDDQGQGAPSPAKTTPLSVLFDPTVMAGFRAGVLARVQIATRVAEMEMKVAFMSKRLSEKVGSLSLPGKGALLSDTGLKAAFSHSLLAVEEQPSVSGTSLSEVVMNPVDQNVPAWALFGMFFTAIPIAGTLLEERRSGISRRLAAMPVSPLQLLAGKILAYLGVCLSQFLLIVLIGIFLFPSLGLPAFSLPPHAALLFPVVCACGLAACGFGIFLGAVCRSYEQASTLGATVVVISAALGGVMVPVYAMPQMMQKISIISPLNWGVHAFSDLLVRGTSFTAVVDDVGRLLLFSVVMIILSWKRAYNWV